MRNYGRMLVELSAVVPDGIVCFFVSYLYMDRIISAWHDSGVLKEIMQYKLVFIETQVRPYQAFFKGGAKRLEEWG